MSNLTIALDGALIAVARVRAIEEGTSLSAQIREFVRRYGRREVSLPPEPPESKQQTLADLMNAVAQEDPKRIVESWTRDEINNRGFGRTVQKSPRKR